MCFVRCVPTCEYSGGQVPGHRRDSDCNMVCSWVALWVPIPALDPRGKLSHLIRETEIWRNEVFFWYLVLSPVPSHQTTPGPLLHFETRTHRITEMLPVNSNSRLLQVSSAIACPTWSRQSEGSHGSQIVNRQCCMDLAQSSFPSLPG